MVLIGQWQTINIMQTPNHWTYVLYAFLLATLCGFISSLGVALLIGWHVQLPQSPATFWVPPYVLVLATVILWWKRRAPRHPAIQLAEVLAFLAGPILGLGLSVPFACGLAKDCF